MSKYVGQSMKRVEDQKALTRVSRMLDHVIGQAYRGEKPMSVLAARLESVVELLSHVEQREPVPTTDA